MRKTPTDTGSRIRPLREERGLTQEQLAAVAGLTRETVRQIESNSQRLAVASLETLEAIARALDVPVAQMIPRLLRPPRET